MAGKRLSLATLAGQTVETVPGSSKPTLVHVTPNQVAPTPLNPRQDFDPAKLEELGSSMADGQLQPCVGITRARYLKLFPEHEALLPDCRIVMAAGERRWKAALHVGLPTLDVHVREDIAESRVRFLTAGLTENVERSNFNYIEEARGLQHLLEMTDGSQTQAAEKLKKSKQWFSQRIGLLRLSQEMQALVVSGELKAFREMRMYSALPAGEQLLAWQGDREAQQRRKAEPKTSAAHGDAYTAVYTEPAVAPATRQERQPDRRPAAEPEPVSRPQAPAQHPVGQEQQPALPEPRSSATHAPDPTGSAPTTRRLPALGWGDLADALVEELPLEDRHQLTTKLLRVMTTEKGTHTTA